MLVPLPVTIRYINNPIIVEFMYSDKCFVLGIHYFESEVGFYNLVTYNIYHAALVVPIFLLAKKTSAATKIRMETNPIIRSG